MNASPARTMIGSGRSTQPSSPTVAVASRPRRLLVAASILKTSARSPASLPSRWNRGMIRASAKRNVKQVFVKRNHDTIFILPVG